MKVSERAKRKLKKDFPPTVRCPRCKRGFVYPRVHLENASKKYASIEDITYQCEACKRKWDKIRYNKHNKVIMCDEIKED